MPRTQLNCPNCRQPIVADVEQLFDVGQDPRAKQAILSGLFNIARCPHCGYQGNLATPIVYHDPSKELLLTYVPPELGLTRDGQERVIGPLIKKAVDSLPQEKRKGYLFSPKSMLTHKSLLETILAADGITREMIEAQEKKVGLIQRLVTASKDSRAEIIAQEDELIDEGFFVLLSRFVEAALMGGDRSAAENLRDLEDVLLERSTFGAKLKADTEEVQAARQALEEQGDKLTREKLLDLVLDAPGEARLRAYVQMTRPGMDYQFFQQLSEKIERAQGDAKNRLVELREKLLEYTREVDETIERRLQLARRNLETLLRAENVEAVMKANMAAVDEFFLQVLAESIESARQAGDVDRSSKLLQIMTVIEQQAAPPPEFELVNELLDIADNEDELVKVLSSQAVEVNARLLEIMGGLMAQLQASTEAARGEARENQQEMLIALQKVYNVALRLSMEKSFAA